MSAANNIRIGGRLRLAFGGLFLALALVGGIGLYQAARLNVASVDLSDDRIPSVVTLGALGDATMRFREAQGAAILVTNDAANIASIAKSRSGAIADVESDWKDYQGRIDAGEEQLHLAPAIDAAWKAYLAQDARLQSLIRAGDKAGAGSFYTGTLWPFFSTLRDAVSEDLNYNIRQAHQSGEAANAAFTQSVWMIGLGTVLAAALAVALAFWLNRNITARVVRMAASMHQLADRDYEFDLPDAVLADEIGDMARAMDACRGGLKSADALSEEKTATQSARSSRAASLERLSQSFETKVGQFGRGVVSLGRRNEDPG
jgi:methyl-accepting chemotaxis protein